MGFYQSRRMQKIPPSRLTPCQPPRGGGLDGPETFRFQQETSRFRQKAPSQRELANPKGLTEGVLLFDAGGAGRVACCNGLVVAGEEDLILLGRQVRAGGQVELFAVHIADVSLLCRAGSRRVGGVQLGIGGMPTVLGKLLARSGLHDLGMHTELCSDAYLELHEAGVLTNRRCTLHRNQGMLGITIGSQRLYDWVDDNPGVIAAPLSYVNAPEVIAQLDNMVSINSCIAADLYGQVASESSGLRQISGTGGQLDFLTGAAMARGGKAFICMTSTFTDRDGVRHSRILPHFGGDIVTSPRAQAYYLATEQGVVNLAGRSTWERAEALVSIAHPDFRDELIRAAEAQKIWRRSAKR